MEEGLEAMKIELTLIVKHTIYIGLNELSLS